MACHSTICKSSNKKLNNLRSQSSYITQCWLNEKVNSVLYWIKQSSDLTCQYNCKISNGWDTDQYVMSDGMICSSVGKNCLMVDIVSKWEEIQDMADIIWAMAYVWWGRGGSHCSWVGKTCLMVDIVASGKRYRTWHMSGGRWVIVTQCGKLLDGRHCSKWEEIQDMAYVWGGGLLVLSGENLFDGWHCSKWEGIQDMADVILIYGQYLGGGGGWGHWSSVGENCYMFVVIGTEIHNNGRQRVGPLVLSCVMIVPRQIFF